MCMRIQAAIITGVSVVSAAWALLLMHILCETAAHEVSIYTLAAAFTDAFPPESRGTYVYTSNICVRAEAGCIRMCEHVHMSV